MMDNLKKNRELIVKYFKDISGVAKPAELLDKYMTDEVLREHIIFFEGAFPCYELFIEEMISEGNKVFVRGRLNGTHLNEFNGIPPTNRKVDFAFSIRYVIENGKIADHWMIADQMILMEQLGVMDTKKEGAT
ncbi:MAG: ester cyclase [Eudoraea sp.]|nr:ester cyclase [Eudoraea sp.]